MQHTPLTDHQVSTIVNGLRVAAERYREDAAVAARSSSDQSRLCQQFNRQAREAVDLADFLESADVVVS